MVKQCVNWHFLVADQCHWPVDDTKVCGVGKITDTWVSRWLEFVPVAYSCGVFAQNMKLTLHPPQLATLQKLSWPIKYTLSHQQWYTLSHWSAMWTNCKVFLQWAGPMKTLCYFLPQAQKTSLLCWSSILPQPIDKDQKTKILFLQKP